MTTPIKLSDDENALIRAAWTAMDQTYGKTGSGYVLQAIDNSGRGRMQPWHTPQGFKVVDSIEDSGTGGKVVIYKNHETGQVVTTSMEASGNADFTRWFRNPKGYRRSQWWSKTLDGKRDTFQTIFYRSLNVALEGGAQLVLAGDSKGGAQAQFMLYDIVKHRDSDYFKNQGFTNLANLENTRIAIVARSMPGTEDILRAEDPAYRPDDPKYSGISSHYCAARMHDGSKTELVSQVGGGLIANDGNIYYFDQGVGADPSLPGNNGNQHAYLHRLAFAGYDGLAALDGDFSLMNLQPRVTIDLRELAAIGGTFAGVGQGETVQSTEALARIGSGLICESVWSPLASLADILQGQFSLQTVLGIPSMLFWASGLGPSMLAACGISVDGANGARYLGDGKGGVVVSNEDLVSVVSQVKAPPITPDGNTRYFGHALSGGTYVFDAAAAQSSGTLYCVEQGMRTVAFVQSQTINFSRFDPTTGGAIADGVFTCEPGQPSVLRESDFGMEGQIIREVETVANTEGKQVFRSTVYLDETQKSMGAVEEETLESGAERYSVFYGTGVMEYSRLFEQLTEETVRITTTDASNNLLRTVLRKRWQDEDGPLFLEEDTNHVTGEKSLVASDIIGGGSKTLRLDSTPSGDELDEGQRHAVLDELHLGATSFINALRTRDKAGLLLSGAKLTLDYARLTGAADAGFDTLPNDAGSAAALIFKWYADWYIARQNSIPLANPCEAA